MSTFHSIFAMHGVSYVLQWPLVMNETELGSHMYVLSTTAKKILKLMNM